MKVDLLGQAVLLVAILLLVFFATGKTLTHTMMVILGLWQLASAVHLLLIYSYLKRLNFVKAFLVLVVSLPLWMMFVGYLAYVPVFGVLIWYFTITITDTIKVYKRPRSFWEL